MRIFAAGKNQIMTSKGSNKHTLRWILLMLIFGGIFILYFYAYFGGFKKVKPIDTEEFAKCAADHSTPDNRTVILTNNHQQRS